jgi:hypothetical protein
VKSRIGCAGRFVGHGLPDERAKAALATCKA